MTGGIFKYAEDFGYARATNVMSTKSETEFEWSVELIGTKFFSVGIASRTLRSSNLIYASDKNAIAYSSYNADIRVGENPIHSNLTELKSGDVIRFRFQPQRKKLLIDLVRN